MSDPWVEARSVTKHFDAVSALADVSTGLEGPGIVGLIGPNGSGKSTLLGVLSGLITPNQGEIYMGTRRMTGEPPNKFAAAGLTRTFQQVRLVPNLRIWENIAVGIQERVKMPVLRERVQTVADLLGVSAFLDDWPADLPMGVQRRVQVASAVVSEPRIVLLDEPAAGLTDGEADDLVDTVRSIAKSALVVVVEHNMRLVYSIASRVLVLMEGVLVADGTPVDVAGQKEVRDAYLGAA